MKLFVFIAFFAVASCRSLEENYELLGPVQDNEADELRKKTETLISAMENELELLKGLVLTDINSTADIIQINLDIINDYTLNRAQELSDYLVNKIQTTAEAYPSEAQTFYLSLIAYIKGDPPSLQKRIDVALQTAVRKGNATIRDDTYRMDEIEIGLDSLTKSLQECVDDKTCLVNVAEEAVDFNTEFINTFNDIIKNFGENPKRIVNVTVTDIGNVVAVNEDFVCNTADIMLDCLASYDDELPKAAFYYKLQANDGSRGIITDKKVYKGIPPQPHTRIPNTLIPTSAPSTTFRPSTDGTGTTGYTNTVISTSSAPYTTIQPYTTEETTTAQPTTQTPVNYCQHPPFSPNVHI